MCAGVSGKRLVSSSASASAAVVVVDDVACHLFLTPDSHTFYPFFFCPQKEKKGRKEKPKPYSLSHPPPHKRDPWKQISLTARQQLHTHTHTRASLVLLTGKRIPGDRLMLPVLSLRPFARRSHTLSLRSAVRVLFSMCRHFLCS